MGSDGTKGGIEEQKTGVREVVGGRVWRDKAENRGGRGGGREEKE